MKTVGTQGGLLPALLLSGAGYIVLAFWFPLLPNLERTSAADIRTFAESLGSGLAYAALILLLFGLLIVVFRRIWRGGLWDLSAVSSPWVRLAAILGISALFGLPLVLTYPVNANDLFRYAQRGRVTSLYGGNPFTDPLTEFSQDPFFRWEGNGPARQPPTVRSGKWWTPQPHGSRRKIWPVFWWP
ncbi:MAG: hypothetical protein R3C44_04455 [Chloroflexota bacterium]